MISLLQRVSQARVLVNGQTVGAIDTGLLVLLCAEHSDTEIQGDKLLAKILKLRIFSDDAGKMNRSVQDVGGGLLIGKLQQPLGSIDHTCISINFAQLLPRLPKAED